MLTCLLTLSLLAISQDPVASPSSWPQWAEKTDARLKAFEKWKGDIIQMATEAQSDAELAHRDFDERLKKLEGAPSTPGAIKEDNEYTLSELIAAIKETQTKVEEVKEKVPPGSPWYDYLKDGTILTGVVAIGTGLIRMAGRVKRTEEHVGAAPSNGSDTPVALSKSIIPVN